MYLTTGVAVLLAAAIGIILLFLAHSKWHENWFPFFPDILRDLGIAMVVSSIIAVLIEIYRYAHHRFGAMREMFDLVMSERITPEVWLELKELIELKDVIRRNAHIRLSLERVDDVPVDFMQLSVEYGYELHGLRRKAKRVTIHHELDYQFAGAERTLPYFTNFTVDDGDKGTAVQTPAGLAELNKAGEITRTVWVPERGGRPVHVWIERREIVPVPGSYNLYTTEFMKGLTIIISGIPANIRAEVWIRPQGPGEELRQVGTTWYSDQLILPGQGIEAKFINSNIVEVKGTDRALGVASSV
jgi:hypothetical protein